MIPCLSSSLFGIIANDGSIYVHVDSLVGDLDRSACRAVELRHGDTGWFGRGCGCARQWERTTTDSGYPLGIGIGKLCKKKDEELESSVFDN